MPLSNRRRADVLECVAENGQGQYIKVRKDSSSSIVFTVSALEPCAYAGMDSGQCQWCEFLLDKRDPHTGSADAKEAHVCSHNADRTATRHRPTLAPRARSRRRESPRPHVAYGGLWATPSPL